MYRICCWAEAWLSTCKCKYKPKSSDTFPPKHLRALGVAHLVLDGKDLLSIIPCISLVRKYRKRMKRWVPCFSLMLRKPPSLRSRSSGWNLTVRQLDLLSNCGCNLIDQKKIVYTFAYFLSVFFTFLASFPLLGFGKGGSRKWPRYCATFALVFRSNVK